MRHILLAGKGIPSEVLFQLRAASQPARNHGWWMYGDGGWLCVWCSTEAPVGPMPALPGCTSEDAEEAL